MHHNTISFQVPWLAYTYSPFRANINIIHFNREHLASMTTINISQSFLSPHSAFISHGLQQLYATTKWNYIVARSEVKSGNGGG